MAAKDYQQEDDTSIKCVLACVLACVYACIRMDHNYCQDVSGTTCVLTYVMVCVYILDTPCNTTMLKLQDDSTVHCIYRYSCNEGISWKNFSFTTTPTVIWGVVTEPGETTTEVT